MPSKEHSTDYSDLSPELVELVRALQASLTEKRVRQQLQSVESERPSKLESAFAAQQAKRASEPEIATHPQLLAALVESADAGIISETWNGVLLTWNRGAERIFGFGAAEMIGNSRACLIPEFLKSDDAKIMKQLIDGKATLSSETVWQHKDGKFVDVAVSFSPVVENDKVVRLLLIVNDITDRKRMERALMESERKQRQRAAELRIVLDAVPAAVCIANDPECKSITGNRMAYDLLRLAQGSNLAAVEIDAEKPATYRMFRNGRAPQTLQLRIVPGGRAAGQCVLDIQEAKAHRPPQRRLASGRHGPNPGGTAQRRCRPQVGPWRVQAEPHAAADLLGAQVAHRAPEPAQVG